MWPDDGGQHHDDERGSQHRRSPDHHDHGGTDINHHHECAHYDNDGRTHDHVDICTVDYVHVRRADYDQLVAATINDKWPYEHVLAAADNLVNNVDIDVPEHVNHLDYHHYSA